MEKLTSLNLSFDKILIQIIIPGLMAIFPWVLFYLNFHPKAKSYFISNPSALITAITFLSLIAGMFLENLGGRFEVQYIDKKNSKSISNYKDTWNKYLELCYEGEEPIGQRYLRNILLRMKFELSAGIALIPMIGGLLFHNYYNPIFENWIISFLILLIIPLGLSFYLLFYEALSSSKVLANTRQLLVNKYHN